MKEKEKKRSQVCEAIGEWLEDNGYLFTYPEIVDLADRITEELFGEE